MTENSGPSKDGPVNLLALDGGGIRGLSELLILDEAMKRIQYDLELAETPRPCDYFHLIGGTSTGGLIALLLGRFRMSTSDALQIYNTIAGKIFCKDNRKSATKDGAFKATTLENAVRELATWSGMGDTMMDPSAAGNLGKAFVCAMPARNMEHPRLFRTYRVRENASVNCKIWEAARATTAAPTFFKRISIGEVGQVQEEFIDGAMRCNNPVDEVLKEARSIFGDDRILNCLVSIGTGHPGVIGLSKPDGYQLILPTELIHTLHRIVTDCEQKADEIGARFRNIDGVYFRLNVLHGLAEVSLEEWEKMAEVQTHTRAYLGKREVSGRINELVDLLKHPRKEGRHTLGSACGFIPSSHPQSIPRVPIRSKPRTSPIFTGRERILARLEDFFKTCSGQTGQRKEFLLYGMGGAGKTQLSLKFAEQNTQRFKHMFWIDANSKSTLEQCFKDIGAQKCADASVQSAVQWLGNLTDEYLLLIDNVEDFNLAFESLPENTGNIIFTTRNHEARLSLPEGAYYEVTEMDKEESLQLLARARRLPEGANQEEEHAKSIVTALGYLPLAIDQAGAYMVTRCCDAQEYLRHFNRKRSELLQNLSYRRASSHDQAVYATFDVSYSALEQAREDKVDTKRREAAEAAIHLQGIFAMLHRENIMKDIFRRAAESGNIQFYLNKASGQEQGQHLAEFSNILLPRDEKGRWDPEPFKRGTRELLKLALIKPDELGTSFYMHPLVHFWAKDRLSHSDWRSYLNCARAVLAASINWEDAMEDIAFRRRLFPHVVNCEQTETLRPETLPEGRSAERFAYVLYEAGAWHDAEGLFVQAVEVMGSVLGQEHPETLISKNNLAETYRQQGQWEQAEGLHMQVLETRKRVLGQEHPHTLLSMDRLALTYLDQGRWKEAEEIQVQVVEMRKRVIGREHPDTLTSMNNLATVYMDQDRWKEAEELLVQVVEIRKRVNWQEHPETLCSMNNLASCYWKLGRYGEAESIKRHVLELIRSIRGLEHPQTLIAMRNLASTLKLQGKKVEAVELMQQCCRLREKVLGNNPPRTIDSQNNLEEWNAE